MRCERENVERVKTERHIKRVKKQLATAKEEEQPALEAELQKFEDNLLYVKLFPQNEKYLSLYAPDSDASKDQRATILQQIKQRLLHKEQKLKTELAAESKLNEPQADLNIRGDDFFFSPSQTEVQEPAAKVHVAPGAEDDEPVAEPLVRKGDIHHIEDASTGNPQRIKECHSGC